MIDEIEQLRVLYASQIPAKRDELLRAVDELVDRLGRGQKADWSEVEHVAHRLAGSAGTFGFAQLSGPACSLDELLAGGRSEPGSIRDRVRHLVAAIDEAG